MLWLLIALVKQYVLPKPFSDSGKPGTKRRGSILVLHRNFHVRRCGQSQCIMAFCSLSCSQSPSGYCSCSSADHSSLVPHWSPTRDQPALPACLFWPSTPAQPASLVWPASSYCSGYPTSMAHPARPVPCHPAWPNLLCLLVSVSLLPAPPIGLTQHTCSFML